LNPISKNIHTLSTIPLSTKARKREVLKKQHAQINTILMNKIDNYLTKRKPEYIFKNMGILQIIEKLAQEIKTNPKSIDLSTVYKTLVQAREVVLDGLNRSKDADKLKATEQENVALKKDIALSAAVIEKQTQRVVILENDIENFNELYAHLKNVAIGRATLTFKESPEILNPLLKKINDPYSLKSFMDTKRSVDKLFNEGFNPKAQPKELNLKGDKYINPKYFHIGGN